MNRYHRIAWSLALILAFIIGSAAPVAARESRHEKEHYRHTHHKQAKHAPVIVKGHRYFFFNGGFYRKGLHGYVAVNAPLGCIILSLPVGSHSVVVGGTRYHVYAGVYYRHVLKGYEVVRKPYLGDAYCSTNKKPGVSGKVMVIPSLLNVRQGPGKRHSVIYKVYRDDMMKIIGRAPGWVYVHLPYGDFGWVMTKYVIPAGSLAKG